MRQYGCYEEWAEMRAKAQTEEEADEAVRLHQIISDVELFELVEKAGTFMMATIDNPKTYNACRFLSKGQWLLVADDFARVNHQKSGAKFWKKVTSYIESLPE